jgi:hypothetical protein
MKSQGKSTVFPYLFAGFDFTLWGRNGTKNQRQAAGSFLQIIILKLDRIYPWKAVQP